MRTRFRTLLLAGAASLAMSGAALAQTTVNGSPAPINGVTQIVYNGQNISTGNPLPVAVVSGGGGGGGTSTGPYYVGQYNSALPTFASGQTGYLSLDANGRVILAPSSSISISNFPASQPVTNAGTFAVQNTAAIPAGSNTIGSVNVLGGNATAVKTDGSATTQPVSAASLPLPAGAATQATLASIDGKTPALGTQTRAASQSTTPASDLANIEPAGAPITGAAMPTGGTGLTGWLSAIWNQLVASNNRNAIYVDAIKQSFGASTTNYFNVHNGGAAVTKGSYTAGCSVAATMSVRGSNDNFTSSIFLGTVSIPAGSDSPSSPVSGSILQFPAGFSAYQGVIVMGASAGTCTSTMSLTAN